MTAAVRSLVALVVPLLVVGTPQFAFAQLWGDLAVPGGVPALRLAIDGRRTDNRPDALWLHDFIRRTLVKADSGPDVDRVREYVDYLGELKRVTAECPERCRLLPRSAPGADRDRVRRLLTTLGLERDGTDQPVALGSSADAKRRHVWLTALGVEPVTLADALNSEAPVRLTIADGVFPLPLPEHFSREVFRADRPAVLSILADRQASLLYLALMVSDRDTLRALASNPALVRHLHQDHAAAFAVVSGSLRMTAGGVDLPGGADAAPTWEELVGRKPSEGDRFIRALLSNDSGRLAYFFSMLGQFDPARQAFVLGAHLPPRERVRYVARIYRQFVVLDPGWSVLDRPLFRPDFDPFLAFALIDLTPDGTIGPLWWPSLLERISDSADWPDRPASTLRSLKDHRADALWLMGWLFADPKEAESRFRVLRFAQRRFALQPRTAAPAMEVALRAARDMPVLARTLERMGIEDPVLYQLLALAGRALEGSGDERDIIDLRRWQSALSLVEQIDRRHPLPAAQRVGVLSALSSIGLLPEAQRPGALGAWLSDRLLPAYVVASSDPADREQALLTAFTRPADYATPHFTWEGLDYVFDAASSLTRGVLAIRNSVRVPRLVDVAALHTVRERLESGVKTVDELRTVLATMQELSAAVGALPTTNGRPDPSVAEYEEVLRNLARITTRPRDLNRVVREVAALRRVIDEVADVAMRSTAFALASVPTSEAAELFSTRFTRHVIVSSGTDVRTTAVAWELAKSETALTGGTILRGSLLGLDIAMAESLIRNPGTTMADALPVVSDTERASILMRVGVAWARGLDTQAFDGVVAALVAGRAQIDTWMRNPPTVELLEQALRDAGVSGEMINAVLWHRENGTTNVLAGLGAAVSFRLGGGNALPEGWGFIGVQAEACWCARRALPIRREALLGRRDGIAGATDEELAFRLVELVASSRVPRETVSAVLPFALFDWLENIRQSSPEDSDAVRAWPGRLDDARFEQYLLLLAADGVFAPPKSGGVQ